MMERRELFCHLGAGLLSLSGALPGVAQGKPAQKADGVRRPVSPWDVEAREYLGTPRSEAAVNRGLAFLSVRQEVDGHWRSGVLKGEVGITALAILAYLAAGHQPGRGRYGVVMSLATDYLANSVRMDGSFPAPGLIRGGQGAQPMYGHGFGTLALAEVYGMTRRRDLKPRLEAAVRLIEESQNQDGTPWRDGGWRYQPHQSDADISVTVVQILALRAARNAGVRVAQSTIDRAVSYIRRCSNRSDGGFSYQVGQQQSGPARTGAAVLSLLMAGLRNTPECQGGLNYLQHNSLDRSNEWPYREHFYYALYYVTQAMYQAGGGYWRGWYPRVRDYLVKIQLNDGSWSHWSEAGPEYATAMAVLVLQVPAGLLPIYQKL